MIYTNKIIYLDNRSTARCCGRDVREGSEDCLHANDNAVLPVPELTDEQYMLCGAIKLNDLLDRLEEKFR